MSGLDQEPATITYTVTDAADNVADAVIRVVTIRPAFDLNVDGSDQTDVSDGLMIIRYIAGTIGGGDLTAGLSIALPALVADNIAN